MRGTSAVLILLVPGVMRQNNRRFSMRKRRYMPSEQIRCLPSRTLLFHSATHQHGIPDLITMRKMPILKIVVLPPPHLLLR